MLDKYIFLDADLYLPAASDTVYKTILLMHHKRKETKQGGS